MKNIKLTAKPNTYYQEGTEVFNYEGELNHLYTQPQHKLLKNTP